MNKKNHIISMVAIVIVVAGGAFYGGMQYGTSKTTATLAQGRNGGAGGGQRGFGGGAGGGQRGGAPGANGGAGDFSGGQITSKDDTSITVKTRNGSSQIIFFAPSTTIDKSVSGTNSDLNVGQQITANGKSNPDGSLAAQNIQIRPAQPTQSAQ
jgi:hypothetical protein